MITSELMEKIRQYESGSLDMHHEHPFYQQLLESGLVWKLQGHYQRTAMKLIKEEVITPPNISTDKEGGYYILVDSIISSQVEDLLRERTKRELTVVSFSDHVLFKTDCMMDLDARFYSLLT